ncbi:serine hydrolase domain-containing protein [Hugenholtzia roseola]|uniref:serine hydrolase domain-containing protein n=1 Tax=Hugenholtzia roseola TaxID=1002 RepID=UPI0012B5F6EA|nr:serine hydrolase [Hugenholtzia roseola]
MYPSRFPIPTTRFFPLFWGCIFLWLFSACLPFLEMWRSNPVALDARRVRIAQSVLLENKDNFLPIQALEKTLFLTFADAPLQEWERVCRLYYPFEMTFVPIQNIEKGFEAQWKVLQKKMAQNSYRYDKIVVGLATAADSLTASQKQALETAQKMTQIPWAVVWFGNPQRLGAQWVSRQQAFLTTFASDSLAQNIAAQMICGGIATQAEMPFEMGKYAEGYGLGTSKIRLEYSLPEDVRLDSEILAQIDDLAAEAIAQKATPSCQILVAKEGKIVYQKAFGYHTYDSSQKASIEDRYDIASITKISAATLALMKLYDEQRFNLDTTFAAYLPFLKNTNKDTLIWRDMLTHQARLQVGLPHFYSQFKKGKLKSDYFFWAADQTLEKDRNKFGKQSQDFTHIFSDTIAADFYVRPDFYQKIILKNIADSKLLDSTKYVYSDVGMTLVPALVENITGENFETFLYQNFYQKLYLQKTCFNPVQKNIPLHTILPTEDDQSYRKQVLRGYVHDPTAAAMGGISGHAGLFSNSYDLAVLMQMLLNGGQYGGTTFFSSQTVAEFIRCQFCPQNRRALGFDKPTLPDAPQKNVGEGTPLNTFGHYGFTGTALWADPDNQIIYIFLSNRVFPKADNNQLSTLSTRTKVQAVIYKALF